MKPRKNFTLEEDVVSILDELAQGRATDAATRARATATATSYLEGLVRDAERDWRAGLAALRRAGWEADELRSACVGLRSYHLGYDPGQPAVWVATEVADRPGQCDPARWAAHVERLRDSEVESRCLLALAREFWRANPRVERALRDGRVT